MAINDMNLVERLGAAVASIGDVQTLGDLVAGYAVGDPLLDALQESDLRWLQAEVREAALSHLSEGQRAWLSARIYMRADLILPELEGGAEAVWIAGRAGIAGRAMDAEGGAQVALLTWDEVRT